MQVLVKLFAEFREAAGRDREWLELGDGSTVGDALNALGKRLPQLRDLMFEGGHVRDHLHVFVNGQNVATAGGLEAPLTDGDTMSFFPPVGGG